MYRQRQQLALGEECLLLLILLITEMPAAPDPSEEPDHSHRRSRSCSSVSSSSGTEEYKWGGSGVGAGGPGGEFGGGPSGTSPPAGRTGKVGRRGAGGRVARQLRRELVHRLASAPCTHSELQDTCYATSHNDVLEAEVGIVFALLAVVLVRVVLLRHAVSVSLCPFFVLWARWRICPTYARLP